MAEEKSDNKIDQLEEVSLSDVDKQILKDEKLKELMNTTYSYPGTTDPDFQEKIYRKREFYYHKYPERPEIETYDQIKTYRDQVCAGQFKILSQQAFLGNFINPDTPYRGVLVMHGTGTGKTCAGI